ncbi:uncharacterized protein KGF55_002983 [Candida pseudojiufengensis]|uniref:uncharacterized protein n=1 Tax=Candida pseudojiufengensis TaxID=497109 RepID=UPI0022242550|nr:uncharacterized protein KGF55_002983 [Candida pseudojiufengensis]KAI5963191.1 hypothetical protein KGF55_002983 [Candida pseudojiufengensis]
MLSELPLEIQMKLLHMVPHSNLKYINSHFYILYNDLFYHKIINTFGEDTLEVIIKILPWLKPYIKSLDSFRFVNRMIIAKRLNLIDDLTQENNDLEPEDNNPLNVQFVKDSWKYIYSILKNKRLYAEYSDYKIDEPSNYIYNHFVEINRTYLLSYSKYVWLAPGMYNLNIGLAVKYGHGLGTTKFEIKYHEEEEEEDNNENENDKNIIENQNQEVPPPREIFPEHLRAPKTSTIKSESFYPPTNINDMIPKNQFCFLKLGQFKVPPLKNKTLKNSKNKLRKIEIKMEEIGLYLKSGFRIYFIDISQPSLLYNEYDLSYYTLNETDYKYFINILLKNLYKALNYVQNGGCSDNTSISCCPKQYGKGNPYDIWDKYDRSFLKDYSDKKMNSLITTTSLTPSKSSTSSSSSSSSSSSLSSMNHLDFKYDLKKLDNYSKFYFQTNEEKNMRRYFKFSTIYQQRQFINKYGDFNLDWKDEIASKKNNNNRSDQLKLNLNNESNDVSSTTSETLSKFEENSEKKRKINQRNCRYDKQGLKWRIPIIGEL